MASKQDYIPSKDADFDSWFKNLLQYVGTKTSGTSPEWPAIPKDVVLALGEVYSAWHTAYDKVLGPHTTADTRAKNDARAAAQKVVRPFVQQYLMFPPVTDEDRRAMAVPVRDRTPSNHPAPVEQPETVVENTKNHFEHKIIALNPDGRTNRKPDDAYGVKTAYQVGGERPSSGEDLPKSKFSRKTSITITYSEADKGKPVYYATRYENAKGEGGPWSPIVEAYIG